MDHQVKKIDINQFDYALPAERIAKYPLAKRDASKLLCVRKNGFDTRYYYELPALLKPNAHLIFNQTRVVQARLYFPKNEHTSIEIFCLEPWEPMPLQLAMERQGSIRYTCMIGGAKKWKEGKLHLTHEALVLTAEKLEATEGVFCVEFTWEHPLTFAEMLEHMGKTPLPPYMKRASEADDKERYQTVYARENGSVAAPTAGLHFTEELLQRLKEKEIGQSYLTLHVGAGTFKPVSAEALEAHTMHAEEFFVEEHFVRELLDKLNKKDWVCVGTTSLRALESTYWLGCMLEQGLLQPTEHLFVPQWVAYEDKVRALTVEEALSALLEAMEKTGQNFLRARTQIIIAPGYPFKIARGLLTNFHQPRSTLLLLVSAIVGDRWKEMYQYALDRDYRFLSYGDGAYLPIDL